MKIGELARRSGVSVRAVRYYEEQGLLTSTRTPGGHRQYPDGAVQRIGFVQQLYAAGLASRHIAEILPCVDTGGTTQDQRELLAVERDRLHARITELLAVRDRLDGIIAAAGERAGAPA